MDKPVVNPPPLPRKYNDVTSAHKLDQMASRDQRVRAGIIDHTIDSTLWIWLMGISIWCVFNLSSPLDARSFILMLSIQFKQSVFVISTLLLIDLFLGTWRGQTIGQFLNNIYKKPYPSIIKRPSVYVFKIWLHGLFSRCLGMPLLYVCVIIILLTNPIIHPMHLSEFSLIEPDGSLMLLVFLLKIMLVTLLLFGVFLPFGLGFLSAPLPTWYDRLLGVVVVQGTSRRKV